MTIGSHHDLSHHNGFLSTQKGLSRSEVEVLAKKYGPNKLPEPPPLPAWRIFVTQLKSPLIYVLIFASVVTFFLGDLSDTTVIIIAVVINTILGFIQERKANQAFAALKQFVTQTAEVIRESEQVTIDTAEIVPGDVVVLTPGAKVPADGELIFDNRVFFDEAIITGESTSVSKAKDSEVFMGTTVTAGQAVMKVTAIGVKTNIGSIAQNIQSVEGDTPLKQQLSRFSSSLVRLILVLIAVVFLTGILSGRDWAEMFTTAIALAVSSIPEGLAVSLTVVLAIGMQRILKKRGLVRKLASAETLGSVTTICVDKTGTLTEGKMRVVEIDGDKSKLAQQVLLANDLDDPLVIAAYEWGNKLLPSSKRNNYQRIDSIPFSSQERFFMSLHQLNKKENLIFVNGAPDLILQWTTLSKHKKQQLMKRIDELTMQGRRLVGFAQKKVKADHVSLSLNDAKKDLEWVGLLAFFDPVRDTVKANLKRAQQAGIRVIVITGDYANTATYLMKELGLDVTPEQTLTGAEVAQLTPARLAHKVNTTALFARTTPDQKLDIVTALQHNGEVVAMMGDGVNDAPAINQADVGIAVSEASDVARESADLVLLDSNFATIIAATEEGRAIFDNIRKIILYLLTDAFVEIVTVLGTIIFRLPLPVLAVQIIWVNLVSDGFPDLALTIDPKRNNLMREKPRSAQEPLVNTWMKELIIIVSLFAGVITFITFMITWKLTGHLEMARSMTFITLGLNSLAYVFSIRSLLLPFWQSHPFANKWLWLAVAGGFILQVIPFLTTATRSFFKVVPLGLPYWLTAIGLSILVFFLVEICKSLFKLHERALARRAALAKPETESAHSG